ARNSPTLLVHGDPRRQSGIELRGLGAQFRHLLGLNDVAGEENDAAHAELAREALQLRGDLDTVKADDEQAADGSSQGGWGHDSVLSFESWVLSVALPV